MEYQDWKPVILKKKKKINQVHKAMSQRQPNNSKFKQLDGDDPVPPREIDHNIKIRIQQARVKKKLTQKQLAQKLNMTVNIINEYESGKAIPNRQVLSKMGRVLGVKLN